MSFLAAGFPLVECLAAVPADPWVELEKRGAIVSRVEFKISDVFNLQDPHENHFVGRVANFIHIKTRSRSLLPALLFQEGEPVSARLVHATERLLRSLPSVQDAEIEPVENPDGTVIAVVNIHDAWSLKFSLNLSHIGGQSEWSANVKEFNFLGWGKQFQVGYEKTIDRSGTQFVYHDPFLFNSRWTASVEYQHLSDGLFRQVAVGRPFYDISTPWSAGITAGDRTSTQTFYETDRPVYDLSSRQYAISGYAQFRFWSRGNAAQRLGLEFRATRRRYDPPTIFQPGILPLLDTAERRYRGMMGYWAFYQDDHITRRNVNLMAKVEDFNLGWEVESRLGYFPRALGSLMGAFYLEGYVQKGMTLDESSFFIWNTQWRGRRERSTARDLWSQSSATYFDQRLPYQTLVVSTQGVFSHRPDPEDVTYLGGTDGLRGYMNYFKIGDERWMMTFEDRVITPWKFWGLVQAGFVGYLDAGGVRELATGRWSKSYVSMGAGLRIGNLKSAFGRVISVTVATPLVREPGVKGIQLVIGTGERNERRLLIGP